MGGSLVCVQHRGSPAARASPPPSLLPCSGVLMTEAQAGPEERAGSGNTQRGQASEWELSQSSPGVPGRPLHPAFRRHTSTTEATEPAGLL